MTSLSKIKAVLASQTLADSLVVKRLTKAEGVIACADKLRKSIQAAGFNDNDETFVRMIHGDVIPFVGLGAAHPEPAKSFSGLLVRKERHALRHPTTGQFVNGEPSVVKGDLDVLWHLGGAVHPALAALAESGSE